MTVRTPAPPPECHAAATEESVPLSVALRSELFLPNRMEVPGLAPRTLGTKHFRSAGILVVSPMRWMVGGLALSSAWTRRPTAWLPRARWSRRREFPGMRDDRDEDEAVWPSRDRSACLVRAKRSRSKLATSLTLFSPRLQV